MCLITWRWCPDQENSLLLISNRDEFFDRPTEKVKQWHSSPILAGQDLRAGGTWLGVTASGRLAALTNYRSIDKASDTNLSRGELVVQFLESNLSSKKFIDDLLSNAPSYSPFNLLVFDGTDLLGLEGRCSESRVVNIKPGFGGVSNADFNTPWFKQSLLQANFASLVERESWNDDELLSLLSNEQLASIEQLPYTGVPLEKELALSAIFVRMENYGTRASSVVQLKSKEISFTERGFDVNGKTHQTEHKISLI